MEVSIEILDQLQSEYKTAVEQWIVTIRAEEALASCEHSVAEIDQWEQAGFNEEAARDKAKRAKKTYENGLREKFFHF